MCRPTCRTTGLVLSSLRCFIMRRFTSCYWLQCRLFYKPPSPGKMCQVLHAVRLKQQLTRHRWQHCMLHFLWRSLVHQTAGFVLSLDMHTRTLELGRQVEDCKVSLQKQYGAIQAGIDRYCPALPCPALPCPALPCPWIRKAVNDITMAVLVVSWSASFATHFRWVLTAVGTTGLRTSWISTCWTSRSWSNSCSRAMCRHPCPAAQGWNVYPFPPQSSLHICCNVCWKELHKARLFQSL